MADLKPTGRNLALGTGTSKTFKGENRNNQCSAIYAVIDYAILNNAVTSKQYFTISFDYELKNDTAAKSMNVGQASDPWNRPISLSKTAGKYHVECVWKFTNKFTDNKIGFRFDYLEKDNEVTFSNFKVELGTEATPWTPAPEDSLSGGGTNMILAFDVITLATVTDVQGIYRFYQLATSKPSKPTTYPPASAWSDKMPGYQLGNQDSLYFVDVTVFNDLTYQYGEVQLSTDYEAVKATYADALQQIANAEKKMQSDIQKTSESIRMEVSEDYYKKDQTDDLLGTISTALDQTKDSFMMQFNSFQADLENINADNSAKFQELYQYIRFKGGSIELGESGNTITLTIENDRISFKQAGQEIAYMSNNQLYITDANIVTSLRIGNFIFSPRPNGSLDFKKVGA